VQWFYLVPYSIELRTILHSPLKCAMYTQFTITVTINIQPSNMISNCLNNMKALDLSFNVIP